MDENLNKLIAKFVLLSQEEKAKEIINSMKEDIALFQSLCKQYGYNDDIIFNREMIDVTKSDASMDDQLEAIYAYLKSFEDIVGKFLNNYLKKNKQ